MDGVCSRDWYFPPLLQSATYKKKYFTQSWVSIKPFFITAVVSQNCPLSVRNHVLERKIRLKLTGIVTFWLNGNAAIFIKLECAKCLHWVYNSEASPNPRLEPTDSRTKQLKFNLH